MAICDPVVSYLVFLFGVLSAKKIKECETIEVKLKGPVKNSNLNERVLSDIELFMKLITLKHYE